MEIQRSDHDGVATLTLDDGDKNTLDLEGFRRIGRALDACADADAIVLAGRDGILSAGLNVKVLAQLDRPGLEELLVTFGRTVIRLWTEPRPTVCAATGHAIAAGTMLAMACDHAVASTGDHRWGLTETRIGFELPRFAIELARANVRGDRLEDLLLPGAVVDPRTAVEAGFADELADDPPATVARAQAHAAQLAELPRAAYAGTKHRLRGQAAERVLSTLEEDISAILDARG